MAESRKAVEYAETLLESDPDAAHAILCGVLDEEPDNPLALFGLGALYVKRESWGAAYNLFRRVVQLAPHRAQGWNNLGLCLDWLERHGEARKCFEQALKRRPNDPDYIGNLALTWLEEQNYARAIEIAGKALSIQPGHPGAAAIHGYASLALGDWKAGWKGYEYALGGKHRKEYSYGGEPRWDGSPGKRIVVYGEQGLGDEIMAASMIPDAAKDCEVVMDCDPRLEGLFRRSFQGVKVYGTRKAEEVDWLEHHKPQARAAAMSLAQFYRLSDASFRGGRYLVADPERRLQWRALFDSWGPRKRIGICWSGGTANTGANRRAMGLEG